MTGINPRAVIGSNSAPIDAFDTHISDLFALISETTAGATVVTDEQDAALDKLLDDMRQARKDADAARADEKRPHDEAAKAVQARWKPLIDRCDAGAAHIKALLTPYREAKQRAKDEAARKAREAADEAHRAAQGQFQQADDLESRFAAEEALKASTKLAAVAKRIDRAPTGLRTRYIAELVDPVAALKHYRETQADALKAWLIDQAQRDTNAGARVIPGFAINEQKRAA